MTVRVPHAFSGFSGVALADILANGVSIIIILILVSLMVRYEQEQMKLEQAEDVSVLLSRELASSFVMNALPTSPPAVLHDYYASPLDLNPDPAVMPIIELRDGLVRNYHTGDVWRRNELLRQNNGMDRYIRSLTPEQLQRLRVDVYAITEFYIAMSILKQYNHQPNHWHFLGGEGGGGGLSSLATGLGRNGSGPRDGPEGSGDESRQGGGTGPLPRDVSLAGSGDANRYGYGGGADIGFGVGGNGTLDIPGMGLDSRQGQGQGQGQGDSQSQGRPGGGSQTVRFRTAVPTNRQGSPMGNLLDQTDMFTLTRALYAFMEQVQEDADNRLPSVLQDYDFARDVLALALRMPPLTDSDEIDRVAELTNWMRDFHEPGPRSLGLSVNDGADARGLVLAVPANERVQRVELLRDDYQPVLEAPPEEVRLSMRLGIHRDIHKGVHASVDRGSVFMTPDADPDPEYRWRVVTRVNGESTDFLTGFLFAAVDPDGRLLLPVGINGVAMDGLRLNPTLPTVEHRDKRWWLVFFSAVLLLAALGRFSWRERIRDARNPDTNASWQSADRTSEGVRTS